MPQKQRRLIIFAPGWGGLPPKGLNPLLQRLNKGFDVVSLSYPNHGFGSLVELSRGLRGQISALRPAYEHITWIGHSMGGLVPWIYEDSTIAGEIDAFVSLGTPWNGSELARFALWSESARYMIPGCMPIKKMKLLAEASSIPKLSVVGAWDFVVPRNGYLENSTKVTIPHCSHTRLIASERSFQEIWAWLTYEVFKEVGHEDAEGYMSHFKTRVRKGIE